MKKVYPLLLAFFLTSVFAAETPIGQGIEKNGMQIGAVYLQPTKMKPQLPMSFDGPADAHLEMDIHALKNNPNGFGVGEWIPYLQVSYHLQKVKSDWQQTGTLIPMVASDGPHYGANIKFGGPGKYRLTYHINPPSWNGFARHYDKETGVGRWFKPFDVNFEFNYFGTGKKGGY